MAKESRSAAAVAVPRGHHFEMLPHGPRADFAHRAAGDIGEVVMVLARLPLEDITPPVLQMVEQRVHELAMGICAALSDDVEPLADIRGRLYPSGVMGDGGVIASDTAVDPIRAAA